MEKYKTIESLWEFLNKNHLRVINREWNIITFDKWKRAIVEFDSEYFN